MGTTRTSEKSCVWQRTFVLPEEIKDWAIIPGTARLYSMNLFLHNIGDINAEPPMQVQNILISSPRDRLDYLLSDPPFGKESSITLNTGASKTPCVTCRS